MSTSSHVSKLELTAGGGTHTVAVSDPYTLYYIYSSGPVTLTAPWIITYSGSPVEGLELNFIYSAVCGVTDVYTITVMGYQLTSDQATKQWKIHAYYNGSAWEVRLYIDFQESAFITSLFLKDDAVTEAKIVDTAISNDKLANLSRGYIKVGNSSTRPTDLNAATNGYLLIGDGSDLNSVAMSGDVTITNAGVTSIGSGKITQDMLDSSISNTYMIATVDLSATGVANLNGSPPIIISSPGPNKAIKILGGQAYNNYYTTPFAFPGDLLVRINGVTIGSFTEAWAESTTSVGEDMLLADSPAIFKNSACKLYVASSDPSGGAANSVLQIRIIYTILDYILA